MRKLWKKLLAPKTEKQMAAPVPCRMNVESGAEMPKLPAMHQHEEHVRLIQRKAQELMPAQVEFWPGSVDDAATYGSWSWIQ